MYVFRISGAIAAICFLLILFIFRHKLDSFLKDKSVIANVDSRSYSLSKTLMFYWTVIVFLSICYIAIVSDNLPEIDRGVLILLGIVAGTTTAGAVIDTDQSNTPGIVRTQDVDPSVGFLTDILSDKQGISVSRFQTVIFNLIYGFGFIGIVISQQVLFDFPANTLMLLGISSGAYALLKIPENK